MKLHLKGGRVGPLLMLLMALILSACDTGTPAAPTNTTAAPTNTPVIDSSGNVSGGESSTGDAAPTPGNPNPSGSLVLYTTRSEALIKPVIDAFQKANPGIEVKLLTGNAGTLGAKLIEERDRPQADVYLSTDMLNMASLAEQGIFTPIAEDTAVKVPAQYRADDNAWVSLTLRGRVIMYNTNLVKPEEAPTSVFELTDPKWKGQVGSADSTNGAIQAHIAAIRKVQGEPAAEEFVKGLVANDTKFFGGHTDVRKAVGAGELKLGFVNHYYYQLSKAEGAPVGVVYPDQGEGQMGLVVNSTAAGVPKGAPNEALGRTFVDFLLTPEGQKVFADGNFEYPIISGVALAEGVAPLDGYRQADVTFKTMWEDLQPTKDLMQRAGMP
jgi:iron(III) transport system substrate-binding protein